MGIRGILRCRRRRENFFGLSTRYFGLFFVFGPRVGGTSKIAAERKTEQGFHSGGRKVVKYTLIIVNIEFYLYKMPDLADHLQSSNLHLPHRTKNYQDEWYCLVLAHRLNRHLY